MTAESIDVRLDASIVRGSRQPGGLKRCAKQKRIEEISLVGHKARAMASDGYPFSLLSE